jgi:hypothetical protein
MNYSHVYVIYNPNHKEQILVYNADFSPVRGLNLYNGFIDPDIYSVVIDNMKNIEEGTVAPSGEIVLNGKYTTCKITYRSALTEFEFLKLKAEYKSPSMNIQVLNSPNEEETSTQLFEKGFGGIKKLIVFPSLVIFKENRIGKPTKNNKEYMYKLKSESELVKELKR